MVNAAPLRCNLCKLAILGNGTFDRKYGACHKDCLNDMLKWQKQVVINKYSKWGDF